MGDEHAFWRWREELLAHPEGRAVGGEPCVICGEPIPPNAHHVQRDRHTCSPRCNSLLKRRVTRALERAERRGDLAAEVLGRSLTQLRPPEEAPSPRVSGPRVFATRVDPDRPYEFEGYCPLPGDVVERHGIRTTYEVFCLWPRRVPPQWFDGPLYFAYAESGHFHVHSANDRGEVGRTMWGSYDASGNRMDSDHFICHGIRARWAFEFISDVTPDGLEYRWEAPVAVPDDDQHVSQWWTPEYHAASERKRRISNSTARHARRVRESAPGSERFDPLEIYEAAGWLCGLCGLPVDQTTEWPDPLSPSLDHVLPLAAGGSHTRENVQLAHWICNVRKGARTGE